MVDDASAPERAPRVTRATQAFDRIVVVGGGCYGSYYVRQLARAERAQAIAWGELIVVDRDPRCQVATLARAERPSALRVAVGEWREWFAEYLDAASMAPEAHRRDAVVPSPLMPHLLADWLVDRARARWPDRQVGAAPLAALPRVPWQRAGEDGTHYVSFAEWMCPINCVEPARCPHTRGERSWSLPVTIAAYAAEQAETERPVTGHFVFHCAHRAYGVGMIDVAGVLEADRSIADLGARGAAAFLIGTTSHCHGALRRLVVGRP